MDYLKNFIPEINLFSKIAQLTKREVFRNSVWMLVGQACISLSAFVLTYVLANFVNKDIVGMYRYLLSLYASISVFALLGMGTALMRSTANGNTVSLSFAVKEKMKYGILAAFGMVGIAAVHAYQSGIDALTITLLGAAIALPCIEAYSLYSPYLQGASRFKESSIYSALARILINGAVIFFAFFYPNLYSITAAYLISTLLISYFFYRIAKAKVKQEGVVDAEMLPYAKHLTFMGLLSAFVSQLDKFILFWFFGPVSLATYWIASIIPQEFGRIVSTISQTLFPKFVREDETYFLATLKKFFLISFGMLILISVVYFILAPYVFELFFPKYIDIALLSAWLMFAFACVPHLFVWQILSAKKKVGQLYVLSIADPALQVVLYFICIPLLGIPGLVLAQVIKTLVLNIAAYIYLIRTKHIQDVDYQKV
jgi:O-antigen/teichoic acid export membrane protein